VDAVVVRADLRVRGARSLKDKRQRIRPVIDRLRHRMHLSVSEVGHQDAWNRAEVAVAVVAPTSERASELLDAVEAVLYGAANLEVLELEHLWIERD
jgi:uncharacterized protein YlxP (DUF503 family)